MFTHYYLLQQSSLKFWNVELRNWSEFRNLNEFGISELTCEFLAVSPSRYEVTSLPRNITVFRLHHVTYKLYTQTQILVSKVDSLLKSFLKRANALMLDIS